MWIKNLLALTVVIAISTSCATINRDDINATQRVAIVGFDAKITGSGNFSTRLSQYFADQQFGPKLYQISQKMLKNAFGWDFAPLQAVRASPRNKKAQEGAGKLMTLMEAKDFKIIIPGILSGTAAVGMISDPVPKKNLMSELKADGLMTVSFHIEPQGTKQFLPIQPSVPLDVVVFKCNLSIRLYKKGNQDPIWNNGIVLGEQADKPSLKIYDFYFPNDRQAAIASACSNALKKAIQEAKYGS